MTDSRPDQLPPPPLGTTSGAASGAASGGSPELSSAAAHFAASGTSPWLPIVLAWLVPGAGHLKLGRRWPALFVAGSVIPLFVGGMALAGFVNVSPERHPWMFGAQAFAGLPSILAAALTRATILTESPTYGTAGELYTAIAGLLNLVAIADVWARCHHGDPVEGPADEDSPEGADDLDLPGRRDVARAPAAANAHVSSNGGDASGANASSGASASSGANASSDGGASADGSVKQDDGDGQGVRGA